MKKYLLISFISLFTIKGNAQSIFPESGTVWLYETKDSRFAALNEKYTALGDTIIKDQHYTKVYRTASGTISTPTETIVTVMTNYIGAYRTVNEIRRVFYFPKDSSNEYILIDFSLKVGDVMPHSSIRGQPPMKLEKIDTVFLFCQQRVRQTFKRQWGWIGHNIEGVGSFWPSFDKIYFARFDDEFDPTLSCIQSGVTKLETNYLCKSDNCIVDNLSENTSKTDQILIYPNPTTGVIFINNINSENISVYNSVGQLVFEIKSSGDFPKVDLSNCPKGYYIIKSGNRISKVILE